MTIMILFAIEWQILIIQITASNLIILLYVTYFHHSKKIGFSITEICCLKSLVEATKCLLVELYS